MIGRKKICPNRAWLPKPDLILNLLNFQRVGKTPQFFSQISFAPLVFLSFSRIRFAHPGSLFLVVISWGGCWVSVIFCCFFFGV